MPRTMITIRLYWDDSDPTIPGWAYGVTRHADNGSWEDIDSGGLSEAMLSQDDEAGVLAQFRRECPDYADVPDAAITIE
jgi:hypothetical protein